MDNDNTNHANIIGTSMRVLMKATGCKIEHKCEFEEVLESTTTGKNRGNDTNDKKVFDELITTKNITKDNFENISGMNIELKE